MKLRMEIELSYDEEIMHGGDDDPQAKEWFFKDILKGDTLLLHSNKIGDVIGSVKVLSLGTDNA